MAAASANSRKAADLRPAGGLEPERASRQGAVELQPRTGQDLGLRGLRIGDGHAVTLCAPARNSGNWQAFLARLEQANPTGTLAVITDNLSSHSSVATRAWLAEHPRIEQVFIPKGACWLNLQEAWWHIFRRHALAGQTFADSTEIARATEVATTQLNSRAKPWVWGRSLPPPRVRRRHFTYLL